MNMPVKIRWSFHYACRYLAANGPSTADDVGAVVWKGKKRGRVTSSGGGGDYAAQMLLGRMKKAGLVRHAASIGSTRWEVTSAGLAEAEVVDRNEDWRAKPCRCCNEHVMMWWRFCPACGTQLPLVLDGKEH